MKLVEDVKSCWKWFSTWLLAMNGTFIVAYQNFQTVQEYIPVKWAHMIVGTLLILTFLGRVIKQGTSNETTAPK